MKAPLQPVLPLLVLLASCGSEAESAPEILAAAPRDGWSPTAAESGFTLVAPLMSKRVYLVDMAGNAVHQWDTAEKPGEGNYLTERGTLLRSMRVPDHPTFQDAGGFGGRIQEIDWDGTVLWDFSWDSESGLNHHDIELLPNGNLLFNAWDRTTREAALALGRDPELLEGEEFWAGAVYEVRPTPPEGGEIVWSWHAIDHLVQNLDESLPNYGDPAEHIARIDINGDRDEEEASEEEQAEEEAQQAALGYGGTTADGEDEEGEGEEEEEEDPEDAARRDRVRGADWMHQNAVAYNAELDQIAISPRRFDEIWVIDHGITREEAKGEKGDLLYRWGNPYAHGMGFWDQRKLHGQHNIHWIPEGHLGAGNFLVFNNGSRTRRWSSVDEFFAPRDSAGTYLREEGAPFGPREFEWTYEQGEEGEFYAPFISGVQRMPGGTTLICAGPAGWVFEVTPAGEIVWDWKSPFGPLPGEEEEDMADYSTAMFRAPRYAADHPGIVALREKGAAIPLEAGSGPATNQREEPEEEEGSEEESEEG